MTAPLPEDEIPRKALARWAVPHMLRYTDAHDGIKATAAKVLNASWQRCRVHFMRNALAHASKGGRRVVSALSHRVCP